jgi:hypothetical protein
MATKVKLIADGVITPDQITLTTASTGTNTTAPATTAFVQQEISALVDSSPDALNTLNELAAALGDDENFSTTVTDSIATKLPLAGGTLTGDLNFGDSDKAVFGAGSDLQIYHDGSNSIIKDAGTGILQIRASTNLQLQDADGYLYVNCIDGGNGGTTKLYNLNQEKLATTSTGIDVTGTAVTDGLTVNSSEVLFDNTGGDFTLKLNTNAVGDKNEIIMGDSGTPLAKFGVGGTANDIITGSDGQDFNIGTAGGGRAINFSTDNFASVEMKLDGGNLGIGENNPDASLHITSNTPIISFDESDAGQEFRIGSFGGAFALYDSTDSTFRLIVDGSGNVLVGTTTFNNLSTESGILASNNVVMARGGLTDHQDACGVLQYLSDATWLRAYGDTAGSGYMIFRTGGGGGSSDSEAMRIDSSGRVGIAQDAPGDFNASADDLVIGNSGGDFGITIRTGTASNGSIHFADGTTGDGPNRGIITYDHSDDRMQFNVAAAEKMRIKSDGQITTQGDILPGADVIMANGRGISFAATANSSGSMTSELLDDYEEGTFTPTFQYGTFTWSTQGGFYTKIGRMVTVNIFLKWVGKSGSGAVAFSNFPFTSINSASYRATGSLGYTSGLDYPSGTIEAFPSMSGNDTNAQIWMARDNAAPIATDVSNLSSSGELQLTLTYITD